MSEPRKLHTGSASGGFDQQQYDAARRRAQEMANQNARRRTLQQPVRSTQSHHQQPPVVEEEIPEPETVQPPEPEAPRELTRAQRQAIAYREAADRKYRTARQPEAAPQPRRIVTRQVAAHRPTATTQIPRAQVQELDVRNTRGRREAYDFDDAMQQEPPRGGIRMEETPRPKKAAPAPEEAPRPKQHKPKPAEARRPAYEDEEPRSKKHHAKKGAPDKKGGKKGKDKKKKKGAWWKILLITLLVIVLIFGGAYALIVGALAPAGGNIKLSQLINTPKEFQDKELNLLVTGVDRSSTGDLSAGAANDSNVNDGMTDMILYVHFNNETGELKMLQIPRDTMVTTDASVSGNYRINAVAKTQGSDNNNNMAALCELISDQYKLPIDGYITIRLEMLVSLVDTFGGIELYVPQEMDYEGSHLDQGYQTLKGDACEFLLRTRHIYSNGDIGRLNMQRQFYAALFRKLKSIGNIWDVAKLTPAVLNYMETSLPVSKLVSFAVSMLKIDSSKIMICQMPVFSGPQYQGQSLLYPARQADADLLNQYFRENTGPVDASQLNLCDNIIDSTGLTPTDPNIQQMGGLMAEADEAQKNDNLDGSNQVQDVMASESTASESAAS